MENGRISQFQSGNRELEAGGPGSFIAAFAPIRDIRG
jgi:hypothetical protein